MIDLDRIEKFNEKKKLLNSCIEKIVWDLDKREITGIVVKPKEIDVSDFVEVIEDFKKLVDEYQGDDIEKYIKEWYRSKGIVFFKGKKKPVVFKDQNIQSKNGKNHV
ncbi:MAG TPA: hypothetical protein ENI15_13650 [Spirochaetes bacterium]|nr:hypothetical protein [Spirochaetota bacterium]